MDFNTTLKYVEESLKENEILEGIYDTEIYRELEMSIKPSGDMSPEERERLTQLLATPSAMPHDFDGTAEAWLLRISIWGKIKIFRKDPEDRVNREMQSREFLYYFANDNRNNLRGPWDIEELDINKIKFSRKFWSIQGKNVTEEIIVTIDLRPDLKRAIGKVRSKLGWFRR